MNDNTADVKEPKTWEGWHGPKTNELPSWGIIRYNGDETEDFDGLPRHCRRMVCRKGRCRGCLRYVERSPPQKLYGAGSVGPDRRADFSP